MKQTLLSRDSEAMFNETQFWTARVGKTVPRGSPFHCAADTAPHNRSIASSRTQDQTSINEIDATERHWFAVFTASNNEKKIEKHLKMKDIETFLPLYTATRRWKNRTTVRVELPLFTGYVFARFARNESIKVLDIPMVYSIVGNKAGSLALPASEIEALRLGLVPSQIEPHPFTAVGQRARICRGPLAEWEGVVSRVDGGMRVVLSVDLIKQSVAVRVNIEDVELLADSAPEVDTSKQGHFPVNLEQV